MNAELYALALLGQGYEDVMRLFVLMGLVAIRFLAVLYVLPPTSPQFILGGIRGALVVEMSFFVAAGLSAGTVPDDLLTINWFGYALKEAFVGLVIGFAASTVFWTAESVGALFDTQAGYNNVQMTNPMSDQQSTPVSNTLLQFVVAVFYLIGGLTALFGVIFESFRIWPPLAALPSMNAVSEAMFVHQMDTMMSAVLKIAAPVLIILLLVDLGLGLITRAADKLEPSSLSQPIKGAVTMLLLAFLVGLFVEQMRRFLLPTDLLIRLQSMLQ
jgi:type III secretion protein T